MFSVGQRIKSVRTGLPYKVEGYDYPTIDGQQVVVVRLDGWKVQQPFPALASDFVGV